MLNRLKQVLCCLLCISVISMSAPPKVEAVAVVDDVLIAVIMTILFGIGVTSVNNQALQNLDTSTQWLISNNLYQGLSTKSQDELAVIASKLDTGKEISSSISNATLKDIYFRLADNLMADPNNPSDDSFKLLTVQTGLWANRILTAENVAVFSGYSSMDNMAMRSKDQYYDPSSRQRKKMSEDGIKVIGSYLVCYRFGDIYTNHKSYFCKDKVIGSVTKNGTKSDLSITVDETSTHITFDFVIGGNHKGGMFPKSANCGDKLHGDNHNKQSILLYFVEKNNQLGYLAGYDNYGLCGYLSNLDISWLGEYSVLPSDVVSDLSFTFGLDKFGTGVSTLPNVGSSDITIGITNTGTVALPNVNTGVITFPNVTLPDMDIPDLSIPAVFDKFPFCIPYDIYRVFTMLEAEPQVPRWEIPFLGETVVIDLSMFNKGVVVVRWVTYALFLIGLIKATRTLIKG